MVNRSAFMAAEAQNKGGNRGLVLWVHVDNFVQNLLYRYSSFHRCAATAIAAQLCRKEDKPRETSCSFFTSSCHDYLGVVSVNNTSMIVLRGSNAHLNEGQW
jgi:hypothetical protein